MTELEYKNKELLKHIKELEKKIELELEKKEQIKQELIIETTKKLKSLIGDNHKELRGSGKLAKILFVDEYGDICYPIIKDFNGNIYQNGHENIEKSIFQSYHKEIKGSIDQKGHKDVYGGLDESGHKNIKGIKF